MRAFGHSQKNVYKVGVNEISLWRVLTPVARTEKHGFTVDVQMFLFEDKCKISCTTFPVICMPRKE